MVNDYFEVSVSVAVSPSRKESLGEFGSLLLDKERQLATPTTIFIPHPPDPRYLIPRNARDQRQGNGKPHIGLLKRICPRQVLKLLARTPGGDTGPGGMGPLREHNPSRQQAVNACANLAFSVLLLEDGEVPDFPCEATLWKSWDGWGTLGQINNSGLTGFKEAVSAGFWSGVGILGG